MSTKKHLLFRRLPTISREDFELIFDVLDKNSDDKINVEEFNDICHAIALKFRQEDTVKKFAFYNSSRSRTLRNFVKSIMFKYVVAIVILLNLGTVITETTV
ncbi:hypothetical protein M8C21_008540 [Ambrosia artemisiifolia]|uniref:EF-hand domain-containing protein n=1 Tax=Ambrosia artemisiifolia TaxID=4212 RepID=A0AAD5GGA1_AMBAR|nr:hypothetical protein M8C21_008540 [Ambrosia artemisiifolia]